MVCNRMLEGWNLISGGMGGGARMGGAGAGAGGGVGLGSLP